MQDAKAPREAAMGHRGGIAMRKLIAATLASLSLAAATAAAQSTGPGAAAPQAGTVSVGAEALFWWFEDSPMPVPIVTDGAVGAPGTRTYLGGQDFDTGSHPGFRLSGDYALSSHSGVEANVFYLPSRSTSAGVASSGEPDSTNLIVPYIDAATGIESVTEISYAPIYSGTAREELSNSLLGAEIDGRWALAPAGAWRVDLLGGLRYLRLRETYTLDTSSPYIPPFPQDIWNTTEEFDATNNFYGAQAGVRARFDDGAFFASGVAKLALGAMVQSVDVSGSLTTNDYTEFGATQTFSGGYYALPTNIGNHSRTAFAVVPEVGLTLGYQVTPAASVFAGYSFIYASNVARPGKQISRTVNPTQSTSYTEDPEARIEGPAQPTFQFNDSSFWAQGISAGLAVRF
jgi:hypothetical protein